MCVRIARLVVATVHFLFCVSYVQAQIDPRIENCLPIPSLAQDLRARNAKLAPAPPEAKQKVVISEVKIEGGAELPAPIQEELIASLKKREYEAESSWVENVGEIDVRSTWQDHGYFRVRQDVQVQLIRVDPAGQQVRLFIRVQEGRQYRLKEIQFRNSDPEKDTVFPPEQLRRLIPLEDGEIFIVERIRRGLQALTMLYGTEGHIDFTAQPLTREDEENGEIVLILELDEQKQYRIGEFTVLGLEPEKMSRLKWKLKVGDPFNNALLQEFIPDNKELLPADASPVDVELRRDLQNGLAFLTFDFRRGCWVPDEDRESDRPVLKKRRPN